MTPDTRSLLRAAAVGDLETVKALIAQGTEVDCVSAAGQTPLMLAAGFGHQAIVKFLLESGAFTGATDELGLTAVDWAANFPRIAQLIAPPQSPDETSGTNRSETHQQVIARLTAERMQAANKQLAESEPRVTLGGLAGAILRERVAKAANSVDEQPEKLTDVLPPPAPPPRAFVDIPQEVDSNGVEPVVDSLIDLDQQPAATTSSTEPFIDPIASTEPEPIAEEVVASPVALTEPEPLVEEVVASQVEQEQPIAPVATETEPIEEQPLESEEQVASPSYPTDAVADYSVEADEPTASTPHEAASRESEQPVESKPVTAKGIIDYPEDYENDDKFEDLGGADDDTLSRAGTPTTDDTAPSAPKIRPRWEPNARQRRDAFQSLGLTEGTPAPARISKVQVSVAPKSRQGSTRTLIWILVILFLGGGAYAGYRLSSYFLNSSSTTETTITPKAEPQPQPSVGPVKAAPVVGGELAGTELFVPDAEYPLAAAPQSGPVVVHIRVNPKGMVLSAEATEGHESLRSAAVQAGKQAAFSPEKIRGKGQVIGGTITYTFVPPTTNQTATAPASATSPTTPASERSTARVGGPLSGTEVNVPTPAYPTAAKSKNIGGTVTIVIRVNRSGRVVSWRTLDGDDLLRGAALTAAKQATFDPAKLPGNGDVVGTITFTFGDQ